MQKNAKNIESYKQKAVMTKFHQPLRKNANFDSVEYLCEKGT